MGGRLGGRRGDPLRAGRARRARGGRRQARTRAWILRRGLAQGRRTRGWPHSAGVDRCPRCCGRRARKPSRRGSPQPPQPERSGIARRRRAMCSICFARALGHGTGAVEHVRLRRARRAADPLALISRQVARRDEAEPSRRARQATRATAAAADPVATVCSVPRRARIAASRAATNGARASGLWSALDVTPTPRRRCERAGAGSSCTSRMRRAASSRSGSAHPWPARCAGRSVGVGPATGRDEEAVVVVHEREVARCTGWRSPAPRRASPRPSSCRTLRRDATTRSSRWKR